MDALKHRQEGFEGVHKCGPHETLYVIIERIANAKVRAIYILAFVRKLTKKGK